jgi:SOS-response transcriptional repressor LexA
MTEKLKKNLISLMTEVRLNAEELSRRIGIPASTIKKIRNNDDTNPTLSTLLPIAQYFSLSVSQLIGDEPFPASRKKGTYRPTTKTLNPIPLISWQDALVWPKKNIQVLSTVTTEYTYSKNAYALLIEEDNLENLAKGTILLIDPKLKPEHRDFVIVYKSGQKIPSLKQILFDDGEIYLKPLIQGYKMSLLTSEYKCLGVIVEYIKHLRKV